MSGQAKPEIVIAGAGLIGLSAALELHRRGARVAVMETGRALRQASTAAAGMLAAKDPYNPAELLPLARYSLSLYPAFLRSVEALSGIAVPFQTGTTVQHLGDGTTMRFAENSLDPRQLAEALLAAVRATDIRLLEQAAPSAVATVIAMGAWSSQMSRVPVAPRKGQMLRVRLPAGFTLRGVHRSEAVYVVPRTQGPQAGSALIGATIEDAGFDTMTHSADLQWLRAMAAELVPEIASEQDAPLLEAWAGLRPATPDQLPLLGHCAQGVLATGHYRNGVLLAPATAMVVADLLEGKMPAVDIAAFAPGRFV